MKLWSQHGRGERGAVLVQVGLGLIAMLAFSAFVIDFGVLWVSRGQAQNAADASALAGAVALSYDDPNDRSDTGAAKRNALSVALAHNVWGQAPTVTMADITFPPCPDDGSNACIRVNVFRPNLPTFFARLVGVNSQDTKATATAKAGTGNATDCLKPFALADKWDEHYPTDPGTWTVDSTFDKYYMAGNTMLTYPNPDYYEAPTATSMGTGFHPFNFDGTRSDLYGTPLTLKFGNPSQSMHDGISAGWYMLLALVGPGGSEVRDAIAGCIGSVYKIGDPIPNQTGVQAGPVDQGMRDLINKDPGASWDPVTKSIRGSAFAVSPRIVAIPLFNPDTFLASDPQGHETTTIVVTNILGFFVDSMGSKAGDVNGYLVTVPSLSVSGSHVTDPSSFLRTIQLVR
jgi:hypothetical protein